MRPYVPTTWSTTDTIESSSVTSSATTSMPASARPAIRPVRRAPATTTYPSSCSRCAAASPMPDDAPVISAILFVSVMLRSFQLNG